MSNTNELKVNELWENRYKEYVLNHFLTKIEAFKMIANELGIYENKVQNKISSMEHLATNGINSTIRL